MSKPKYVLFYSYRIYSPSSYQYNRVRKMLNNRERGSLIAENTQGYSLPQDF